MYKKMFCILGLGLNINSYAEGIDVYGVDDIKAQKILREYGEKVFLLEKKIFLNRFNLKNDSIYYTEMTALKNKIEKDYGFKTVLFDTVYYPENKQLFTTIETSKKDVNDTMFFEYEPKIHDLVDKMVSFEKKAAYLMVHHPDFFKGTGCKDFHCITPEHPLVQKDLQTFRREVPKQQSLIEKTIKSDGILARRRAGIFLLGYYKDTQKVANILNELLRDPNFYIRHDSLRVYGELLQKFPEVKTSVNYFLPSIHSIHEAERNKALIVLNELARQKQYQIEMKETMGTQLVRLLKLKQPNNHDLAYSILKQLWQKTYSETDYKSWGLCVLNKI